MSSTSADHEGDLDLYIRSIHRSDTDDSVRVTEGGGNEDGLSVDVAGCSARTRQRVREYMKAPPLPKAQGERGDIWVPLEVAAQRQPERDDEVGEGQDAYVATCPICGHSAKFSATADEIDGRAVALPPHDCASVSRPPGGRSWPVRNRRWNAVRLE